MILVGSISLSLICCSASASKLNTKLAGINLPDPPAYLRPVIVTDPALGEDPVLVAARERQGRLLCNGRVTKAVVDWKTLQSFYAGVTK